MQRQRSPYAPAALATVLAVGLGQSALAQVRVGGWDAARGGVSALVGGEQFRTLRDDMLALFEPATFESAGVLTTEFLNGVDVLLLGSVFTYEGAGIAPLSGDEQSALLAYVRGGGTLLLVTGPGEYLSASNSLLSPFEMSAAAGSVSGAATAEDVPEACSFTQGYFGEPGDLSGGCCGGWFASLGTAVPVARWQGNGQPCVAVLDVDAGRVTCVSDGCLIDATAAGCPTGDNGVFRQNLLAHLGLDPTARPVELVVCPGGSALFVADGRSSATTALRWQALLGEPAPMWTEIEDGLTPFGALVSGAGTNILHISDLTPDDAGAYRCAAVGACWGLATTPVRLHVCAIGDANGDGTVNFNDIDCFVAALIGESAWLGCGGSGGSYLCAADCNRDGAVTFDDIDSFIVTLITGACP